MRMKIHLSSFPSLLPLFFLFSLLVVPPLANLGFQNVHGEQCPFTSNTAPYSRCVDCFTCPTAGNGTCCLKDHEDAIQEALEVYGNTNWNCRLTLLRYSECGRCAPDADRYLMPKNNKRQYMNFTTTYIGTTGMPLKTNQDNQVRLCRRACENLYTQCLSATTIPGELIIPKGISLDEYCTDAPEISTDEVPCYNNANGRFNFSALSVMIPVLLLSPLFLQ